MMGRTHALSGAALWLAAAPFVGMATRVTPLELSAGAVITAGAAMLPDIDHPSSTIARTFGPLTRALAHLVAFLAGGHRKATHGALFVGISAVAAILGTLAGHLGIAILIGFGIGLTCRSLGVGSNPWVTLAGSAAAGYALATVMDPGILPWCYGLGVLAHILGDMCTEQGVPFLWPSEMRWRIATINTNSVVEKYIVVPAIVAVIAFFVARNIGVGIVF